MTTRRIIIKSQYLRICKQIDSKIDKIVLKSIEEYNFIDLITPFNYYFINTTDGKNWLYINITRYRINSR